MRRMRDKHSSERSRSHRATAAVLSAAMLVLGGPVLAAAGSENRVISDRWLVWTGSYLPDFKTDAAVGSGMVVGTTIRAEDELGLDDNASMFRGEGMYRFNSRHAIGFGFWTFNRRGDVMIDRRIEFDGHVFDLGARLESDLDTEWIRADWRYSFFRSERGETGVSLGLSTYGIEMKVAGEATVDDGMGGTFLSGERAEQKILAPVPTFGMYVNFAVTPTVIFRAYVNFLDLDGGDYEGRLTESAFLFEWYPSTHVGVGGGLSGSEIDFKNTGDDPYSFEYDLSGFLVYVTFAWGDVG